MSEYKCEASCEGVCRNILGYGTKCNGYSKECRLRPHYERLANASRGLEIAVKRSFGIKGDRE